MQKNTNENEPHLTWNRICLMTNVFPQLIWRIMPLLELLNYSVSMPLPTTSTEPISKREENHWNEF